MRDLYHTLTIKNAFNTLSITENTEGNIINLQGYGSVVLALSLQQTGEGHSEANTFSIFLEHSQDGASFKTVEARNLISPSGPSKEALVESKTQDLTYTTLQRGYIGDHQYLRLRVAVAGESVTHIHGAFILGHPEYQ